MSGFGDLLQQIIGGARAAQRDPRLPSMPVPLVGLDLAAPFNALPAPLRQVASTMPMGALLTNPLADMAANAGRAGLNATSRATTGQMLANLGRLLENPVAHAALGTPTGRAVASTLPVAGGLARALMIPGLMEAAEQARANQVTTAGGNPWQRALAANEAGARGNEGTVGLVNAMYDPTNALPLAGELAKVNQLGRLAKVLEGVNTMQSVANAPLIAGGETTSAALRRLRNRVDMLQAGREAAQGLGPAFDVAKAEAGVRQLARGRQFVDEGGLGGPEQIGHLPTLPDAAFDTSVGGRRGNLPTRKGPTLPPMQGPQLPPTYGRETFTLGNPLQLQETAQRLGIQQRPPQTVEDLRAAFAGLQTPAPAVPPVTAAVSAPTPPSTVADLGGNVSREAVIQATANRPPNALTPTLRSLHNAVYPGEQADFAIPRLTGVNARDFRTSLLTDHPTGNVAEQYLDYLVSRVQGDKRAAARLAQADPDLLADVLALPPHPTPVNEQKVALQQRLGAGKFRAGATPGGVDSPKVTPLTPASDPQAAFDAILASGDSGRMSGELPAGTAFWERRLGVGPDEARALLDGAVADGRLGVGPDGALRFKPKPLSNVDIPPGGDIAAGGGGGDGLGLVSTLARNSLSGVGAMTGIAGGGTIGGLLPADTEEQRQEHIRRGRIIGGIAGGALGFAAGRGGQHQLGVAITRGADQELLTTVAPEVQQAFAQLRDPAAFNAAHFRDDALGNTRALDYGAFAAKGWDRIVSGAVTTEDLLASAFASRLSMQRGAINGAIATKIGARYPELAATMKASASVAKGGARMLPEGVGGSSPVGKVRPEDVASYLIKDTAEGKALARAVKAGDPDAIDAAMANFKTIWPSFIFPDEVKAMKAWAGQLPALREYIVSEAQAGKPGGEIAAGIAKGKLLAGVGENKAGFFMTHLGGGDGSVTLDSNVAAMLQPGAKVAHYRAFLRELYPPDMFPAIGNDDAIRHHLFWDTLLGSNTGHEGIQQLMEHTRGGGTLGIANIPGGAGNLWRMGSTALGAGLGGTLGAGAGFATADGDLKDRLDKAAQAGTAGAILGGAAGLGLSRNTSGDAAAALWRHAKGRAVAGQAETVAARGTYGLLPKLRDLWPAWRRARIETPKNIGQDEAFGSVASAALQPRAWQNLSRARDDIFARLDTAETDADLLPSWTQERRRAMGLEGRAFNPGSSMVQAERKAARAVMSDTAGALTEGAASALSPVGLATNAIGVGVGALKGKYRGALRGLFEGINGPLNGTFRAVIYDDELATLGEGAATDFLGALRAKGIDVSSLAPDGTFDAADVERVAGPAAGKAWQAISERADDLAQQRARFIMGDYSEQKGFEKLLGGPIPYSSWVVRAYPVALAIAAEHPIVALGLYQYFRAMNRGDGAEGQPDYTRGMLPIPTDTPYVGPLVSAMVPGNKGVVYVDPVGAVSPVSSDMFSAGEDDEGLTWYQKATKLLERTGLPGVNPAIQTGAYLTGLDYKGPGSQTNTQGLEDAAALIPGNAGLPNPMPGLLAAGRSALSPAIGPAIGGQADPNASVYDPVTKRYAELWYEKTHLTLSDPRNRIGLVGMADPDNPLMQQARREVLLAGAARNVNSLVDPVGATAQTDTARQVKAAQDKAALPSYSALAGLDPFIRAQVQQQIDATKAANPLLTLHQGETPSARANMLILDWERQNQGLRNLWPGMYQLQLLAERERLGLERPGSVAQEYRTFDQRNAGTLPGGPMIMPGVPLPMDNRAGQAVRDLVRQRLSAGR